MKKSDVVSQRRVFVKSKFCGNGVTTIELDRPEKRNALSQVMIDDLIAALQQAERHDGTRTIVFTGTPGGPFSAGADVKELSALDTAQAHALGWLKDLSDAFHGMRKPIIAAVEGFALGGGFELALLCDIVYAAPSARFGLPEIKIGTIPGMGGTQRLERAMGKQKAMTLVLTGGTLSAAEAERLGLVSKVVAPEEQGGMGVLASAQELATEIAAMSAPVVRLAKEAVLAAESSAGLEQGIRTERSLYYSTFSLADFKEGTSAFLEKRRAEFTHL